MWWNWLSHGISACLLYTVDQRNRVIAYRKHEGWDYDTQSDKEAGLVNFSHNTICRGAVFTP